MIDLSVIIPMYNANEFIIQCINSVLSQESVNLEVIIIDDGSIDNSADIVTKSFANKVKLFKKSNRGASSARNFGLKKAQGQYIMFIDADDYLDDNKICTNCIEKMKKNNLDFCAFLYKYLNNETGHIFKTLSYPTEVVTGINATDNFNLMISNGIFPASPCFKVIRKELIINNHLLFKEGTTAEDIDWYIRLIISSKKFSVINNYAYVYRKSVKTSVTSSSSFEKSKNLLNRINDSIRFINAIENKTLRHSLMSAMAYEFCIFLANSHNFLDNTYFRKEINRSKKILKYDAFPKVKYIKLACHVFGIKLTAKLLNYYKSRYAKSLAD